MTALIKNNHLKDRLIESILFTSISYNFFLAIINNNFVKINSITLSVLEALLIFFCFVVMTYSIEKNKFLWIIYGLTFILLIDLFRMSFGIQPKLKFLRDVLIQYAFIGLGLSYKKSIKKFLKFIMAIAIIISIISFFEIFFTSSYEDIVNPKGYYINTKNFKENDFWNGKSKLFISATRPNERFLSKSTSLPRASAIFLEPVTLGNFIILFLTLFISFKNYISRHLFLGAIAVAFFLIFASDSRLTFFTTIFMIVIYPIILLIKKDLSVLIVFFALSGSILFYHFTKEYHYQDNFVGRVNYSIDVIQNLSLKSLIGLDQMMKDSYWDSGIAYMIVSHSLFYLLFNLFFYIFVLRSSNSDINIFRNISLTVIIYSLFVSNSFFSIKTASLWWFSFGLCWRMGQKIIIEKNDHSYS